MLEARVVLRPVQIAPNLFQDNFVPSMVSVEIHPREFPGAQTATLKIASKDPIELKLRVTHIKPIPESPNNDAFYTLRMKSTTPGVHAKVVLHPYDDIYGGYIKLKQGDEVYKNLVGLVLVPRIPPH